VIQLPAERRHLDEKHGDAYRDYRDAVPAWFPARLISGRREAGS